MLPSPPHTLCNSNSPPPPPLFIVHSLVPAFHQSSLSFFNVNRSSSHRGYNSNIAECFVSPCSDIHYGCCCCCCCHSYCMMKRDGIPLQTSCGCHLAGRLQSSFFVASVFDDDDDDGADGIGFVPRPHRLIRSPVTVPTISSVDSETNSYWESWLCRIRPTFLFMLARFIGGSKRFEYKFSIHCLPY